MPDTASQTKTEGPVTLANRLLETLEEEREALAALAALFEGHRAALEERRRDLLDAATDETNAAAGHLGRLRQARQRQLRLLGRILRLDDEPVSLQTAAARLAEHAGGADVSARLLALRDEIRTQSVETHRQCQDLEFALNYAIDLGRDLLEALQGLDAAAHSTRTYTPKGATTGPAPSRSYLNKLG